MPDSEFILGGTKAAVDQHLVEMNEALKRSEVHLASAFNELDNAFGSILPNCLHGLREVNRRAGEALMRDIKQQNKEATMEKP